MKNKTIYESLQEYLKNTTKEKVIEDWKEFQHLDKEGITVKEFSENQKQIELVEVAEKLVKNHPDFNVEGFSDYHNGRFNGILEGYKLAQQKLYSEEDLREAFRQGEQNINYSEIYGLDSKLTEQEWCEKFKKK